MNASVSQLLYPHTHVRGGYYGLDVAMLPHSCVLHLNNFKCPQYFKYRSTTIKALQLSHLYISIKIMGLVNISHTVYFISKCAHCELSQNSLFFQKYVVF